MRHLLVELRQHMGHPSMGHGWILFGQRRHHVVVDQKALCASRPISRNSDECPHTVLEHQMLDAIAILSIPFTLTALVYLVAIGTVQATCFPAFSALME